MSSKYLWCGVLMVAVSVALPTSADAQTFSKPIVSTGTIVGVIVGAVAVVVVVTYLVIHESTKKRTITGCITQGEDRMTLADEKDKWTYTLSGNTTGLKPGDRVTLQGKKIRPKDTGKPVFWQTKAIAKDFGACQASASI